MTHLEVGASGLVAVGARLYRFGGVRHLAVVVKASYTLQQRAEMALLPPMDWRTKANVAHAGDEPFPLGLAEIIVGPLSQAARTPGNEVSLAITRGPDRVLDVRRKAGESGALDASVGFGPVAAASPLRAAHSAAMDISAFRGVRELSLEPRFDPLFFQAAPLEQRLGELRGGDVLVLHGMSHVVRTMQTAIPSCRGHAVVQLGDALPRRVSLRLDRVHLAPDAMVAELSFRGMVEVSVDVHAIRVLGGLETPLRPFAPLPFDAVRMLAVEAIADGMPAMQVETGPTTEVLGEPPHPNAGPVTAVMGHPVGPPTVPHGGTLILQPGFESTAVISPEAQAPPSLPFRKGVDQGLHVTPTSPLPGAPWAGTPAVPVPPLLRGADDDRPPETVFLRGHSQPDVVELSLDAPEGDLPEPAPTEAMTERQPAQEAPIQPPAQRVRREKVDPWRKDPEAAAAPAPLPPPPAAKASPTRSDISGGLYKKFKR